MCMRARSEAPETAAERLYVIGGTALAIGGMFKRSTTAGVGLMLLGGALVGKGLLTRKHNIDAAHGRVEPKQPETHGSSFEYSFIVDRPRAQVYAFWRNIESLPRYMPHLESVREVGNGLSQWTAKTPEGTVVDWEAEIVADLPNEAIAWRSLPGSMIRNEGAVYFHELSHDRTEIRVYVELHLPLGNLGLKAAQATGEDPEKEIVADLEAFKEAMEDLVEPRRESVS